jgi:hypothetical protein
MEGNILILSHNSFSNKSNNGKTLESIFSKFEKSKLFQIYFRHIEDLDYSYCNNFLYISPSKLIYNPPNNKIEFKFNKNKILNILNKYVALKYILLDIYWLFFFRSSSNVCNWCKENNITSIFFMAGPSFFSHKLALNIKNTLNIPLFIYFTDDYLIYPKRLNFIDKLQFNRIKKFFKNSIENSTIKFCISEEMSDVYSVFFKTEFYKIMNSVNILNFDFPKDNPILTISYFGSLHTNRWNSIVKFSELLNEYAINNRKSIILKVYTNTVLEKNQRELFTLNNIFINTSVYGDHLIDSLTKSDLLLHCESDDDSDISLTMLSVSTKIPEYCITKRAIIAYGPTNISSFKLLSKNKIGFILDSRFEKEALLIKIDEVFNFKNRIKVATNAYNYVIKNHNNDIISTNFKNIINFEVQKHYE